MCVYCSQVMTHSQQQMTLMDIHHNQSTCHTCCSTSCRPELFRQKQEGPRTSACRALQSCSRRNLGCMALTEKDRLPRCHLDIQSRCKHLSLESCLHSVLGILPLQRIEIGRQCWTSSCWLSVTPHF